MIADKWIDSILKVCDKVEQENPIENQLVSLLVEKCFAKKEVPEGGVGLVFASAFDLLISAEYYGSLSHTGWLYCPDNEPRLFFHYTNCCPRHVIEDKFFFHPSNKPTSGKIGTATSRLLLLFLKGIFKFKNLKEEILKGTEPVDAIIVNRETKQILFAEIKASPLLTLAVSMKAERLTSEVEGEIVANGHMTITNSKLYLSPIDLWIPVAIEGRWESRHFKLGQKNDEKDFYWGFRGMIDLLENDAEFFDCYFEYWLESFNSYSPKSNKNIFWLTNACGTPTPIPEGWQKRRVGSGYESISDSKTSVGMDRTDDIKKGIYQVLKLGSEGKPFSATWDYKVGIISNIHPARHFDDYLKSLKDIVWTNDETGRAKFVKDLPDDQKIYNLFDGIIALTKSYSRDEWIDKLFSNFTL
ncbi:MAG: hypothetical protein BGO54_13330 [Sphingobacteriales bacterium 46-32]|nr:MAG: hypothetical protein BGO54_13330 [Sphingobacteriales bacterium 46-32]